MDQTALARIQLCGRLSIERVGQTHDGARWPPQQQRLFAFLLLHRDRPVTRDELVDAVWGEQAPAAVAAALSALISKLRTALGDDVVLGRGTPVVRFPGGSVVDAERAVIAAHEAEGLLARADLAAAYIRAVEARYITEREFLPGHDLPWVDAWRRRLQDVQCHALETHARSSLALGGSELAVADRATAVLVERAPFRESATALRMEVLEALGNCAEALLVYEELRQRLADELGVSPGPALRARHERLLRPTGPG